MCVHLVKIEYIGVCLLAVLTGSAPAWAAIHKVPDDFPTIQAAITAAQAGDRIEIEPGTYNENLQLKTDIELRGDETARTFVRADSGTVMEINNKEKVTIRNLTFSGGTTGIAIIGSTNEINIHNNVFALGSAATAISIDDVSVADIRHNTFRGNNVAINRDTDASVIKNNIFSANSSDVVTDGGAGGDANMSFNCTANFSFADVSRSDFHLRDGSGCKDFGDPLDNTDDAFSTGGIPDAGAYGGPETDVVSFPVGKPTADVNPSATAGRFDVTLKWDKNLSYLTTDYRIHYDSDKSGNPYDGDDAEDAASSGSPLVSPFEVGDGTASSVTLFNLLATPDVLAAPELEKPAPSNHSLDLHWSAVDGATGYRVEYGIAAADENRIDVDGDVTSFELSNLENGTAYHVRVSALSQTTYFFAVSVLGTPLADGSPDIEETESKLSPERSVKVGPAQAGTPSNEEIATPEEIEPFPALSDQGEGCFIATAAYGHISHPKVQLLRDFRDRFLLTNPAGHAFVRWYYRHSPAAAAFITQHETLRALVRWFLLPLIGIAWLMMHVQWALYALVPILGAPAGMALRRKIKRTEQPSPGY
ncbi:MAG TPA: CFI-box-CTERM domain-containing protein [Gammaproteobacteria bacterium]|nr:CFI-box-CTERM domain-containing protein [Gammaproteobacteria bacterium]